MKQEQVRGRRINKMKVLLKQDVKKVGKKGEVINVADGYGANYLIPNKLAVLYTDQARREYEKELAQLKKEEEIKKAQAEEIKSRLQGITLEFEASAGRRGEMIGTVSFKEISTQLKNKYDIIVDKKMIVDKNMIINGFGSTDFPVELYKGVIAKIKIHVSLKEKK